MAVRTHLPIALELYTVRDEIAHGMPATLRRVAQMGYDGVEFAGYGELPPEEMRDLLSEVGLQCAGSHVSPERLDADFDAEVEYCRVIGCRDLILPSLPDRLRGADHVDEAVTLLNDLGTRCREAELTFGYHNHDVEFAPFEGRTVWEHMVEQTDPALVFFELDVYWVAYTGQDPLELLRRYSGRIPLVHFKDMASDRTHTEVGAGSLALDQLYRDGAKLGIRWAIVEHDEPVLPSFQSAEQSLRYLHAAREAA